WLSRDQRSLEVRLRPVDPDVPESVLLREQDPHWLNHIGPPSFLDDRTCRSPEGYAFLWISEADGTARVYRHEAGDRGMQPLTGARWQVQEIHQVLGRAAYVTAIGPDPRERNLCQVRLNGGDVEALTRGGVHH